MALAVQDFKKKTLKNAITQNGFLQLGYAFTHRRGFLRNYFTVSIPCVICSKILSKYYKHTASHKVALSTKYSLFNENSFASG